MPFELSLIDLVSPYVLQGDTFSAWHAVYAALRVSEHEVAYDENGITIPYPQRVIHGAAELPQKP